MDVGRVYESGARPAETRPPKGKRTVVAKYARHACAQCKKAKTKCEGGEPVCERCQKMGHECNWSLEDARRPLTRAHEQALKHQNALLRAEVSRLAREVAALRLQAASSPASANSRSGPSSSALGSARATYPKENSTNNTPDANVTISHLSAPGQAVSTADSEAPSAFGLIHSHSEGISSGAEERKLERMNVGLAQSDSEKEFDCDVESNYGSAGHESENDSDEDEDSDSDDESDSDEDVDRALVAPTKTLFSEQDDLHHYGLTSVFRLRRPLSHKNTKVHRSRRIRPRPLDRGYESANASGYDSISSSQEQDGSHDHNNFRPFRSLRSYFSANEDAPSFVRAPVVTAENTSITPFLTSPIVATSAECEISDTDRIKRDRKGREKSSLSGPSRSRTKAQLRSRQSPSPVRMQRHVLLVGVQDDIRSWKGCDCQSECWSRWLPKGVPLSRREHDTLLDRTFTFFSSWCMRVIPEYFLRDMYTFLHPSSVPPALRRSVSSTSSSNPVGTRLPTSPPRLAHYSPFLHNMLLAVGSAFSTDPLIHAPETRKAFADEGKSYLEEECSRPNISTVQALGLLASYYSGQGQQTLGFTYFGMSARIAQALGLFADCTPLMRAGRLRARQVFDRTWCFHMAAAQDACWSMYVGRECGIPLPSAKKSRSQSRERPYVESANERMKEVQADGRQGLNAKNSKFSVGDPFCLRAISEDGIGENLDKLTWKSLRASADDTEKPLQCMTFTTFQWSCQLMKIARSIMDLMNRLASRDNGTEIKLLVSDIDIQLDAWRQDLPAELKLSPTNEMTALPHKLMMHAAFWWQRILLHRPFYQRNRSKSVEAAFSVTRCNVAAREILSILRLWRKIYGTIRYSPITLIQTIFAAGTIYILQAMQASSGRRPAPQAEASALDNLEELVGYLRECSESWEAAIRIADTFERLLKQQRRAIETRSADAFDGTDVSLARGRKAMKKRRKLEAWREIDDTALATRKEPVDNRSPSAAHFSDARANDSGFYEESLSPAALQPAPTSNSVKEQEISLSRSVGDASTEADVSPIFASPNADTFPAFECSEDRAVDFNQQHLGANIPMNPGGYLSDDSYTSDAPYPGMSMDELFFSAATASAAHWNANVGTASSSPQAGTNAYDAHADWNFLLSSSEIGMNMDVVMPGMSMGVFDPATVALNLPSPGLVFGPAPAPLSSELAGTSSDHHERLAANISVMDTMDAYTLPNDIDGDVELCDVPAGRDIEYNDSGRNADDHALFDILAALGNTNSNHSRF